MDTFDIKALSPNLFWDLDSVSMDFQKHKAFIVQRILEYDLLKDWLLLRKNMSIEDIATITKGLRSLDDISLNFISKISGKPKSEFRCYKLNQSLPEHSRFFLL